MSSLSACTILFHCFDRSLKYILISHPSPTVLKIILLYFRHIQESISIIIMRPSTILIMCQYSSTQSAIQMYISIKISLILLFTASKKIDIQGLGSLRLLKFNIYLSGNRLITILYRWTTLGHLYALHPWAGNIPQSKRSGCSTIIRNILCQHLYISSREPQQFNLSGPCGSISIAYIYRRVCCETFTQVTTSRPSQFRTWNHILIQHTGTGFYNSYLTFHHLDLIHHYTTL